MIAVDLMGQCNDTDNALSATLTLWPCGWWDCKDKGRNIIEVWILLAKKAPGGDVEAFKKSVDINTAQIVGFYVICELSCHASLHAVLNNVQWG